jgi:hypothetical protein
VKCTAHLFALGIALAVNAAALAMVDSAMLDGVERSRLPQEEIARVEIIAPKDATGPTPQALSAANCNSTRL